MRRKAVSPVTTTPDRTGTESETPPESPIYESLIQEHGDVPTETRKAADATRQDAAVALDWSDLYPHAGTEPAQDGQKPADG
jgi:hypothetical protein